MPNAVDLQFEDIAVGQSAQFEVVVTEESVKSFAELTGDFNPLHVDHEYAAGTSFGGPIAHGMLLAGHISRLVGMHLPGKRALYLSQTLNFRAPCPLGTKVRVAGTVLSLSPATCTLTLAITIDTGGGKRLVDGQAMVAIAS